MVDLCRKVQWLRNLFKWHLHPGIDLYQLRKWGLKLWTEIKLAVEKRIQHGEYAPEFAWTRDNDLVQRPHRNPFKAKTVEGEDVDAKIKPHIARKLCNWDSGVQRICHDLLRAVMKNDSAL